MLRREPLSLRTTLLLLTLAAGGYAGVLPLYLFVRARSAALALGKGTEAIVALQDDLARRTAGLHQAAALMRQIVESRTRPAPGALDTLRLLIAAASAPATGRSYATVPARLRAPLGQSEDAMSRVAGALAEGVAWLERGADQAGAARRLRALDRLTQIADQQLLAAGQQARRDLLERQEALQLAAGEVLRDAIFWLAHSFDVSKHFAALPRRISQLDANTGRTQGDALKYRIYAKWASDVRDQMTQLAARSARLNGASALRQVNPIARRAFTNGTLTASHPWQSNS